MQNSTASASSRNLATRQPVNVSQVMDGAPFGPTQWLVALWCAALSTLDGFDNAVMAYVAPVIGPAWGVSGPAFGPVFGFGVAGAMVGSLCAGLLADRFGRRALILLSTLVFGSGMLVTAMATTLSQLCVLRFLTGLGVGGLIPNVIALTAEFAPQRNRHTTTSVMTLGFALGAGGGGFVGAALIPRFGWQAMFVLGGLLPLLCLPWVHRFLPESVRFLASRGSNPKEVAKILNVVVPGSAYSGDEEFIVDDRTKGAAGVRQLFSEGRGIDTALLWFIFFSNMIVMFFLNNWLPTIFRQAGVPVETALRVSGCVSWGGILGTLVFGPMVERVGVPRVVSVLYLGAAALVFLIGMVDAKLSAMWVIVLATGACVVGAQSLINALAATQYPTPIRSTGVGWAFGVGRIGAICGPVVGGLLLAAHISPNRLFAGIAVPALMGSVAMHVLGRRTRTAAGSNLHDAGP